MIFRKRLIIFRIIERLKMLLRIEALQLSILITRCMRAVSAEGLLKFNVAFEILIVYLKSSIFHLIGS